jgi:hypothetical protein
MRYSIGGGSSAETLRKLLARHLLLLAGGEPPVYYAVDVIACGLVATRRVAPSAATTTTPRLTRPGSPSSPVGPTNGSPKTRLGLREPDRPDGRGARPSHGEYQRGRRRAGEGPALGRLPREEAIPLFIFEAGYEPVRLQQGLEACLRGRRLRSTPESAGAPRKTNKSRSRLVRSTGNPCATRRRRRWRPSRSGRSDSPWGCGSSRANPGRLERLL